MFLFTFFLSAHFSQADTPKQPDSSASSGITTASVAHATAVIEKTYLEILGRKADESGLKTFTQKLTQENRDEAWLRKALRNSPEYRSKAGKASKRAVILIALVAIPIAGMLIIFLRRRSAKDFFFKVILLTASIAAACLVLEAFLRIKASIDAKRNAGAFHRLANISKPPPGSAATLGNIIYLSPDRKLVYELIPGLDVEFMGARMTSGKDGFRTTPGSSDSTNALCIIGLGDSVMFGWGVRDGETYLSGLCRQLNSRQPGQPVKVINMAVPGYNTVMEVETLKQKGLQYRPKLVFIHFVDNDLGLPNFICQENPGIRLTKSHLVSAVSRILGGNLVTRPFDILARPPDEIPDKYRDMVGEQAYLAAMKELGNMAHQHGFKVILLTEWQALPFVRKAADDSGMPLIELGPTMTDYCRSNNIAEYQGSVLTISRNDPHYSPLAHELVCRRILDFLDKGNLIRDER